MLLTFFIFKKLLTMTEEAPFHVVIKLPFLRPADFAEPLPIIWTQAMEEQLWKHMIQKSKDWDGIAERLGIPTSYVVHHAAFLYQTQLKGIHQQLRKNSKQTVQQATTSAMRCSDSPPPEEGLAFLPRRSVDPLSASQHLSQSIQNLNRIIPSSQPGPNTLSSALNSVTSSFSDLSDTSVSQSALEDAFMSKFNHGSKMSSLNFSRRM
ncbi:hypothetical protein BY458DRAFT_521685 [Sporodiniella umbellata]|nr:hypothetical protein BY458DRAFT_521685 [Sporodiniella umbellata]